MQTGPIRWKERWLDIAAAPIQTDGQIGVLVVAIDVTGRKTREDEYRSLQAQLLQAQKMESIGTLAVGLVHNMNNILAIVMGYSSRLSALVMIPEESSRVSMRSTRPHSGQRFQQLTGVAAKIGPSVRARVREFRCPGTSPHGGRDLSPHNRLQAEPSVRPAADLCRRQSDPSGSLEYSGERPRCDAGRRNHQPDDGSPCRGEPPWPVPSSPGCPVRSRAGR